MGNAKAKNGERKETPDKEPSMQAFMRKLRTYFPPESNVVKKDPFTWIIDGKVQITLNYYCQVSSWDREVKEKAKQEKSKKCSPYSVEIRAIDTYSDKVLEDKPVRPVINSRVFRTRTVTKRNGTFNFETIAAAIVKCSAAIDKVVQDCLERNDLVNRRETTKTKAKNSLEEYLKEFGPVERRRYHGMQCGLGEYDVYIGDDKDLTHYYEVEFRGLLPKQFTMLMEALRQQPELFIPKTSQ